MHESYFRYLAPAACATLAAFLFVAPAAGQDDSARELEDWEREELQALLDAVGEALEGDAPAEDPLELAPSFVKGTDGNTYVPFTLTVDPGRIDSSTVVVYLYVDDLQMAKSEDDGEREPVFEGAYFVEVERDDDEPIRLSRAFSVPGGDYDVYLAVRDSLGEDADDDDREARPLMVFRAPVAVPDLWTTELQTSTVFVGEIEQLSAQPSPQEVLEQPYTLGPLRITPRPDRSFGQQEALSTLVMVYNPQLDNDLPNVTVEFNFHTVTDDGEEFFNKTPSQEFNAQTLPPGFSVAAGHQVVAGQSVPLRLFPEADYRLEILVIDNEAETRLTRNVPFSVLATTEQAMERVQRRRSGIQGVPAEVMDTIRRTCSQRWPDDFSMQRFCQDTQIEDYLNLR